MPRLARLLPVVFGVLLAPAAHAQARPKAKTPARQPAPAARTDTAPPRPTEVRIVRLMVLQVHDRRGDTVLANVDAGRDDGLLPGGRGEAHASYQVSAKDRDGDMLLGTAEVIGIEAGTATVRVVLAAPQDPNGDLRPGDMVSLPLRVPKLAQHTILWDLVELGVSFDDASRQPLVSRRTISVTDGDSLLKAVLAKAAEDVHGTAESVRPMLAQYKALTDTVQRGRMKGRTGFDGMVTATPDEIYAFLRFVRAFPGKYMGHRWKMNETFATWLVNNAPPAHDELRDSLVAARTDDDVLALYRRYEDDIRWDNGSMTANWNQASEEWAQAGRFADAHRLNGIVLRITTLMGRDSLRAWTIFSTGRILDEEDRYEESIAAYQQADSLFARFGDLRGQGYALNNIGSELQSLSRYDESIATYRQAIAIKRRLFATASRDDSSGVHYSLAGSLTGLGSGFDRVANYDSTLAAYRAASAEYAQVVSTKAQRGRASVMKLIGKTYGKLGKPDSALTQLDSALAQYRALADRSGESDVLDERGYQLSSLSRYREAIASYEAAYAIHIATGNTKDAGFSKSNIGQCLWSLGEYAKAIAAHEEGIRLREQANDKAGLAYSWTKLAGLYKASNDPNRALDAYAKAAGYYGEIKDKSGLATTYNDRASLYADQDDYARALTEYQKALGVRQETGAQSEIAQTLYDMGLAYLKQKSYAQAESSYEKSLAIRRAIGDKEGQVYSLSELGRLQLVSDGDRAIAEQRLHEAGALAAEINSKSLEAWVHGVLGSVAQTRGRNDEAKSEYERSLALYREAGEKSGEAERLADLGALRVAAGAFDDALKLFGQALDVATSSNSRRQMANAHDMIGDLYRSLGEFDKAVAEAESSLAISREVNNPWGIASAYMGLGAAYRERGENAKTVAYYSSADSIFRKVGSESSRLWPMNNLGTVYFDQGDYEPALKQFREAMALQEKVHDESENYAIVIGNIGEVLYEQHKYADAAPWLDRALALDSTFGWTRHAASVLTVRGKLRLEQKAYAGAQRDLDSAYVLAKRMGARDRRAEIAGVLGKLAYRQNDYPGAAKWLDEAIATAKAIGSAKLQWEPMYTRALLARERGDTAQAIALLEGGVDALENLRSRVAGGTAAQKIFASGESKAMVYDALVALLIPRDPEKAFAYVERSSNDDLRSRFAGQKIQYADSGRTNALAQAQALKAKKDAIESQLTAARSSADTAAAAGRIASLEKSRIIAEQEYLGFLNQTVGAHPELRNHVMDVARTMRNNKARIPADAAVLAYLPGERSLYIFVATHDTVVASVVEIGRVQLEGLVKGFLKGASRAPAGMVVQAGAAKRSVDDDEADADSVRVDPVRYALALDSVLLRPVAKALEHKSKLAILPSGVLFYLPFQALAEKGSDGAVRFLAQERTVFYVRATENVASGGQPMGRPRIVAFGNPDGSLASAELEVHGIQAKFPDARVYVRAAATLARVKAIPQTFNVVHFATHGMLAADFGTSYLKLAQDGSQDDGRLTGDSIQAMDGRNRALVVLSACNTAVTDQSLGDWPNSLALAFLDIGAQTVVASLWPVDDQATSILMSSFYADLPKYGRAEALRRAQETLIANPRYAHPYYWGAFVLMGDWK